MKYKLYYKEQNQSEEERLSPTALTIGNFDGVHLGHQELIKRLRKTAQEQNLDCTALTFEPTPREYFARMHGIEAPVKLMDNSCKVKKLLQAGIDKVIVLAFDGSLQSMSAQDFFHEVIVNLCQAKALTIGEDFRFGKKRLGNITTLKQLCSETNCIVEPVNLLSSDTGKISSSRIRLAMSDNDLSTCNSLLGYDYSLSGQIIHGDGRGKSIGYATANIKTNLPILFRGVFASRLKLKDKRVIDGVTNIGSKPTFKGKHISCETHLFDFDENVYNQPATLSLHKKIREEEKFDSVEQLIAQIEKDTKQAYHLLKEQKQ